MNSMSKAYYTFVRSVERASNVIGAIIVCVLVCVKVSLPLVSWVRVSSLKSFLEWPPKDMYFSRFLK